MFFGFGIMKIGDNMILKFVDTGGRKINVNMDNVNYFSTIKYEEDDKNFVFIFFKGGSDFGFYTKNSDLEKAEKDL